MNDARTPRSRFYDGRLYAWLLDPFLSGLHGWVSSQVEAGQKVLDAGCGTGDLVLKMAPRAAEVVGIELSPAMVDYANRRIAAKGVDNASVELGDVSAALGSHGEGYFDLATMVLVLHEMPADARPTVLTELTRLARRVLCVDFSAPMTWNPAGLANRFFELAAGREHFGAFRDYQRRGGAPGIARDAGLACRHVRHLNARSLAVCEITAGA